MIKSLKMIDNTKLKFMRKAIELSIKSQNNGGGPFGAVIVKDGKIIAGSSNSVTIDNDPTAHAEVNAIRKASKVLNTFDLSGCEIYTSCEPCPMCLGAIYWAHIDVIYYGNNRDDARKIGFDDEQIYTEIGLPLEQRKIKAIPMLRDEAIISFEMWKNTENKKEY
jgi:tRNA(Arg) A34 adenosine deaminase TadA